MTGRARLAFVGPLPPPVHGMAAVNAQMIFLLRGRGQVDAIKVCPNSHAPGFRYHVSKALRALRTPFRLARARVRGARLLYASVDDGWGGLYTIGFVIMARALGFHVWLHHHSYRYIARKSRIMAALTAVAGDAATHVVLCDAMKAALSALYPAARQFAVVPNAVAEPSGPPAPKRGGGPLTLGLLSNLTFDKGLAAFVDIVETALDKGHDVRGILAGPAVGAEEAAFIAAKLQALGGRLEWTGPVSGTAKEAFFAGIDLFVFPTRYRTEALPLTLLEALVRGVPVIVPARGCICLFDPLEAAEVVPLSEDFARRATAKVAQLARDPALLARLKDAARSEGRAMNAAHEARLRQLADQLVAQAEGKAA